MALNKYAATLRKSSNQGLGWSIGYEARRDTEQTWNNPKHFVVARHGTKSKTFSFDITKVCFEKAVAQGFERAESWLKDQISQDQQE